MSFVSYAQNYEDVMLWRALRDVRNGFYVDVGAWSPDLDSVTRAFYDRGWHGMNIEPNPQRLAELKAGRARDLNLGLAASDSDGTIVMYVVADTGLTTLEPEIADQHRKAGWNVSTIEVPRRNFSGLLDDHLESGQPIHFLKIDVEGHETAVVRGIDFSRHRPWVILVEATAPNSQVETHAEWEPVILEAGYRSVYWDGLNRFYLALEHNDLAASFAAPPNVFDGFVRSAEAQAISRKEEMERQAIELMAQVESDRQKAGQEATRAETLERSVQDLREQLEREGQRAEQEATRAETLERSVQDLRAQLEREGQRAEQEATRAETLERSVQDLRAQLEREGQGSRLAGLRADEKLADIRYVTHRTFLEALLFRPSGKPRTAVRRLVFHKSGKPRGVFRALVLHPDGRPHQPFRKWMTSAEYLRLPGARLGASAQVAAMQASPLLTAEAEAWRSVLHKDRLEDSELDALMLRIKAELQNEAAR